MPPGQSVNYTTFSYLTPIPYAAGTQLQVAAGDSAAGGNSGSSDQFILLNSTETFCLEPGYQIEGLDTANVLPPLGSTTAQFNDIPGAVKVGNEPASGKATRTSTIIGGVIGGSVAAGLVIAALVALFIYKKRQKKVREEARREQNIFVDLVGDEDGNPVILGQGRKKDLGVNDCAQS